MKLGKMVYKAVITSALAVLLVAGGYVGWRLVRSDVEARVYLERLTTLAQDYRSLQKQYNTAVRRTAVTELVVHENEVWVRVRTAAGTVGLMQTPYRADGEVFVDYVVRDGRLWIRRVYDQSTAPEDGFVVDDDLGAVEWDDERMHVGKTVYRSLSDGRWVVEVSGNGALGLTRIGDAPAGGPRALEDDRSTELVRAPVISEFDEWLESIDADTRAVSFEDVVRAFVGGERTVRRDDERTGG